jgi:hypothetical protein
VPRADIDEMLNHLTLDMSRLMVLYEQYFIGVEKAAPTVARKEVEKQLTALSQESIGNTALRFRYAGLIHRWKTYSERWDKILREIENGTFPLHLRRMRRRADATPTERSHPHADGRAPANHDEVAVPGMTETELRALHQSYLQACRQLGDARDVKYESLVASLQRQVPLLLERNQCSEVAFRVVVRDGKAVLKAQPKR